MSEKRSNLVDLDDPSAVMVASMEAFSVIRLNNRLGLTLEDMMEKTGYERSFLALFLKTYLAHNYIRLDAEKQLYRLSHFVLAGMQDLFQHSELVSSGMAELNYLKNLTGETSIIAVDDGKNVIVLRSTVGAHPDLFDDEMGSQWPFHSTAIGKVMLAFMPEPRRAKLLAKPLVGFTKETVTDPEMLLMELAIIRERGYATNEQETDVALCAVSVPIFDSSGELLGALGVAGPPYRMDRNRLTFIAQEMTNRSKRISERLRSIDFEPRAPAQITTMTEAPAPHPYSPQWNKELQKFYWLEKHSRSLYSSTPGQPCALVREFATAPDAFVYTTTGTSLLLIGDRMVNVATGRTSILDTPVTCATAGNRDDVWAICARADNDMLVNISPNGQPVDHAAMPAGVSSICYNAVTGTVFAVNPRLQTIQSYKLVSRQLSTIATFAAAGGKPIAITLDFESRLWVGFENGWFINAFTLNGKPIHRCPVQISAPTGLCFGGSEGQDFVVTSRREGLAPAILENTPLSGHVVALRLDPVSEPQR